MLRRRKYWIVAVLIAFSNFLAMFFGSLAGSYIALSKRSFIMIPAGVFYAIVIFSNFIAGKNLFKSGPIGLTSMCIFSLLAPLHLDLFVEGKILFLIEIIFLNLAFVPLSKIFYTRGEKGWLWLGGATVLVLFTHIAIAMVYLFSLFLSLLYLAFLSSWRKIIHKSLLYTGFITAVWLIILFLFPLGESSLILVNSNALITLKQLLMGGVTSSKLLFLFAGGALSYLSLVSSSKNEELIGIKIMLLWFSIGLLMVFFTLFFPLKGIVNIFPQYLLLLLPFLFSYMIMKSLSNLEEKEKKEKERSETQGKKIIQSTNRNPLPLLLLALFLSFTLIGFCSFQFSLEHPLVRGNKFHDSNFPQVSENEDPKRGFGEDFSNISDWGKLGNHKKQPKTDGDKLKMWVQGDRDESWNVAKLRHGFKNGLNTSRKVFLALRVTDFKKTGEKGHFKIFFWDGENYTSIPLVGNADEIPDTFLLNVHKILEDRGISPLIRGMELRLLVRANNHEAMVEVDWLSIYGLKGYEWEGSQFLGRWWQRIHSHVIFPNKDTLSIGTHFHQPGTHEYFGLRRGISVSTKRYIAIKYKMGRLNTGAELKLKTNASANTHVLPASTGWTIYREKLSELVNGKSLGEFGIYLADDQKSLPSLEGEHSLTIDWIKIGTKGKVITIF